jgi:hypothetical protein
MLFMLIAAIQPGDTPGRPRAVNVPSARGHDDNSVTVILSIALLGLHMSVDRRGDSGIGTARFMLIDDRGTLAVVAHPHHQVFEPHTTPGRPRVPRMPKVMEMQAFRTDRAHRMEPRRLPVELTSPSVESGALTQRGLIRPPLSCRRPD